MLKNSKKIVLKNFSVKKYEENNITQKYNIKLLQKNEKWFNWLVNIHRVRITSLKFV